MLHKYTTLRCASRCHTALRDVTLRYTASATVCAIPLRSRHKACKAVNRLGLAIAIRDIELQSGLNKHLRPHALMTKNTATLLDAAAWARRASSVQRRLLSRVSSSRSLISSSNCLYTACPTTLLGNGRRRARRTWSDTHNETGKCSLGRRYASNRPCTSTTMDTLLMPDGPKLVYRLPKCRYTALSHRSKTLLYACWLCMHAVMT